MEISSVRELKLALGERLLPEVVWREYPELGVPAGRSEEAAWCRPTVAVGIAPGGRGGGYRLALRVQQRELLASPQLDAIRAEARDEVDVRYIGLVAKQQQQPWQQTRQRPVPVGCSVGHYAITAGTAGAFVRRGGGDERLLLSNNHVLADENRAQPGDEIVQPGAFDGGERGPDSVALLDRFVELVPAEANVVDGAVGAVVDGVEVEECALRGLGELSGTIAPEETEEVAKIGRTTGLTRGRVSAFEVDNVVVQYDSGLFRFDDQVEIAGVEGAFSLPGDSGSLIFAEPEHAAVALLFAGSDQGGPDNLGLTFANPIGTVLEQLGVELRC